MRYLVVFILSIIGFLSFSQKSFSGVKPVSGSTRSFVEKTRSVHTSYKSTTSLYKKLHRKCSRFFAPKRMIAGDDPRKFYSVEIVSIMPKQKKVTALCVSKAYKNDDVVAVR